MMNSTDVIWFGSAILLVFLLLFAVFCFGWWLRRRSPCVSPYSGMPLRRGGDLSYSSVETILRYLYQLHQYDNRIFDMHRAAVCRETGRIFPNAITWYDSIKVDWSFLFKRYPGNFVSWGSLSSEEQQDIRSFHDSLEGFQTKLSSPKPSPRSIEQQYAFAKPGPLYVDVNSKVLLGWKCIPDTEFEVLIVQKPRRPYDFSHIKL
jgi:hypothetical protein